MVIACQSFPVHKRGVQRSSHPRRGLLTVGQAMLLICSGWVTGHLSTSDWRDPTSS